VLNITKILNRKSAESIRELEWATKYLSEKIGMLEEHVAYVCAEIEKETKHMET